MFYPGGRPVTPEAAGSSPVARAIPIQLICLSFRALIEPRWWCQFRLVCRRFSRKIPTFVLCLAENASCNMAEPHAASTFLTRLVRLAYCGELHRRVGVEDLVGLRKRIRQLGGELRGLGTADHSLDIAGAAQIHETACVAGEYGRAHVAEVIAERVLAVHVPRAVANERLLRRQCETE